LNIRFVSRSTFLQLRFIDARLHKNFPLDTNAFLAFLVTCYKNL